MSLGWFLRHAITVSALTASLSCGKHTPNAAQPLAPRARPPTPGTSVPLQVRLLKEGESRQILAVHQVEESAEWSDGRTGKTSVNYAFEAERRIIRRGTEKQDAVLYLLHPGTNTGEQDAALREGQVLIQHRQGLPHITLNGQPVTEEQRATVAGLAAIDVMERCVQALLPASGAARQGETWEPDPTAAQAMFAEFGAPDEMRATKLMSEFTEVVDCDTGYCARISTTLAASAAEQATLEGQIQFWIRVGDTQPVLRLGWELTLTEQHPAGKKLEKRRVTQREDTLILPAPPPEKKSP